MAVGLGLAIVGVLLLYVAPGFGVTAALFPERLRPSDARARSWLEVATLAFVLSLAMTILFGELLQATPAGFSATWSVPSLQVLDGLVAVMGVGVGAVRGAFSRRTDPVGTGGTVGEGTWPALRELERLAEARRAVDRSLREPGLLPARREELDRRRRELDDEDALLRRRREAEFAA